MIRSVLVANRGEIAVRVIRACRALGMRTIAVYSDVDRSAPHVLLADEAYRIGRAPSRESYLRIGEILRVARAGRADAVHPGYGFLAESSHFAEAVEKAGLVFVGPDPATIAAMGDKVEARRRMEDAGVPTIPGSSAPVPSAGDALEASGGIGFPLLVKAVAGGGGKGMRVVERPEELTHAIRASRREAAAAFEDDRVYLERYLPRPRHVEVQVLGDGRGNVVHLGERDCSIQRRHQKLIEEAPAPELGARVRDELCATAVRAATALSYRGAGTVEFLLQDGEFFFLEMNTRIQVEHPVTECVTGWDLVQWQMRVAQGGSLPVKQSEIQPRGHALECRITAESATEGFLPSTGTVRYLEIPSGPGIRWDGGILPGTEIGRHYDPLLGKLVAHGASRSEAIERMAGALDELVVDGVVTCRPFHRRVMDEPDFRAASLSIRYLDEHPELLKTDGRPEDESAVAAIAALLEQEARMAAAPARIRSEPAADPGWAWRNALRSRSRGR